MLFPVLSSGSEDVVTYENSDMPLYYHQTQENLQERFEFMKAWYSRINDLIRELNPSLTGMGDVFSPVILEGSESIDLKRNYFGNRDLLLLIEELESDEIFRLCNEATRKETWKDLDIEKGFLRLKNDILRQTRILENDKFERLSKSYESVLRTTTFIFTKKFQKTQSKSKTILKYENFECDKIRFDAYLKIKDKVISLAQQGRFGFNDGWIYEIKSENIDNIYVHRYFPIYNKTLSEFIKELEQMYLLRDYEFLLGVREDSDPRIVHLDVLLLSDDKKSLIPVRVRGECARAVYKGEYNSEEIALWTLFIGTPIPHIKESIEE